MPLDLDPKEGIVGDKHRAIDDRSEAGRKTDVRLDHDLCTDCQFGLSHKLRPPNATVSESRTFWWYCNPHVTPMRDWGEHWRRNARRIGFSGPALFGRSQPLHDIRPGVSATTGIPAWSVRLEAAEELDNLLASSRKCVFGMRTFAFNPRVVAPILALERMPQVFEVRALFDCQGSMGLVQRFRTLLCAPFGRRSCRL
ncbi:hypothetical protein LCM08_17925 [Salipiger pacificus]|nr:hypothetical protein [Alloyangia pacifica]MCA0946801.1 hypothetical protein [Alloyangia pacifica]